MNYQITVRLLADALIGSGEGFGAIIDTDVVFDEVRIPYIPGRRFKGCLRDSANEVLGIFDKCAINGFISTDKNNGRFRVIDEIFGTPEDPSLLHISNLTIGDYENNKNCLRYFNKKYPYILPKDEIISYFTIIRQQTKIDARGLAEENSLRTIRAVKKGFTFEGNISADTDNDAGNGNVGRLLWLACLNLRHMGTKRNRGFGEVECSLSEINSRKFAADLESVCK